MSRLKLVLFLCCFSVMLQAQETGTEKYLWPVEGKNAGEDILYRPQDYVDDEHNFDKLFITAEKGTNIVCPCDGVVLWVGYDCYLSMTVSGSFSMEGTFKDGVDAYKEDVRKKGIDPVYLSVGVYFRTTDGRNIKIGGLDTGDKKYITGQKLKRGEVLGKIHYCYKKIPQRCIMLSVETKSGKPSDPMAPFGLKSTFKPPVVQQPKQRLTRAEATADYRQLATGVKEIYPSLDDFMSEAEYDAFVEGEIAKIPESISLVDFARLVMDFNHKIHDSHMRFSYGINTERHKNAKIPPIWFGKVDGGVKIIWTTAKYRDYLCREVARVNGRPVDSICVEMEKYFNPIYDADVQSVKELESIYLPRYYYTMAEDAQKNNQTVFTFADGEELTLPLEDRKIISQYERETSQNQETPPQLSHKSEGNFYSTIVNDSTAYMRLKTFALMDTELEQMLTFIGQLQADGMENLIIDLRNNLGGHVHVLYKLVEAVMDEPIMREGGYQKVNAHTFSGTLNLSGEPMFNEFKQVDGKKGLYLYNNDDDDESEVTDSIRRDAYKGRIYVLINEGSASASTIFAGIMKRNKRGYIVGRETKTAYHCMNAEKFADIQLTNSMFKCHMPLVRLVSDEFVSDEFPYGRGVIPHLTIPLSYKEIKVDNQIVYKKTLDLIANGIYLEDEAYQSAECQLLTHIKDNGMYLLIVLLPVMLLGCFRIYKCKRNRADRVSI